MEEKEEVQSKEIAKYIIMLREEAAEDMVEMVEEVDMDIIQCIVVEEAAEDMADMADMALVVEEAAEDMERVLVVEEAAVQMVELEELEAEEEDFILWVVVRLIQDILCIQVEAEDMDVEEVE